MKIFCSSHIYNIYVDTHLVTSFEIGKLRQFKIETLATDILYYLEMIKFCQIFKINNR